MPVHSAIVMWFGYADAVPAQLFFVHCLTECRKRINQIVAAFPNCRVIPCRVRLPVHQCGVVLRRTDDGIEHGAVATHFSYQFQVFNTAIISLRRCAGLLALASTTSSMLSVSPSSLIRSWLRKKSIALRRCSRFCNRMSWLT